MKMYELITWFQKNYAHLQKELIECLHNYDFNDLNPYHLESDCWSHTMLVCKVAELKDYDLEVQVAALLHDIGKPLARKVNPRNNHVQFFGHEEISAKLAVPVLEQMIDENIITSEQKKSIVELIKLHSLLHKDQDPHELFKRFQERKRLYIHLVQLNQCDALGRFCEDNGFNDDKYKRLISYSTNMEDR